jgi:diketogulonate reductase-like aldo/keto reductase
LVQFGTSMKGEDCFKAIVSATDTLYGNEKEVGLAVMESRLDRKKFFIQTQLWRTFVSPAKNAKP